MGPVRSAAIPPSSRPLRVLLLYDCIYPDARGGVEHRNFEFAQAFARRGHTVCLAGFASRSSVPAPGVEVLSLGLPHELYDSAGRRSRLEALRLARAASRLNLDGFDLVETASLPYLHLLPLSRQCRQRRIPLVVNWHAHWGGYWRDYVGGWGWPMYAGIERWAAHRGTLAIAVSQMTADRVAAQRRRGQVEVVPNGIPSARIAAAAQQPGPPGPELLFAGRLIRERRLPLLLSAVALLAARGRPTRLTLAGEGPDRPALERQARELGIVQQIDFQGNLPSEELWRAMGRAAVAVQPSSRDSFGMFPLEAMAAGLPVVYCVSPDSALPELVKDGEAGYGVAADPEALASTLARLLDAPAERQRLRSQALRRGAHYDWERTAAAVEGLYLRLVGAGAR